MAARTGRMRSVDLGHGVFKEPGGAQMLACGVMSAERREAKFATILHQGHLEEAMETCRQALRWAA